MKLQPIFIREQVIKAIRSFFDEQSFHEVMVPVFNHGLPLEPNIHAFKTEWTGVHPFQELYLSISPENAMKKILAAGIGNCYGIGKSFRNLEGSGPKHNPEFLMLEWYRENQDYKHIIKDTETLIQSIKVKINQYLGRSNKEEHMYQGISLNLAPPWPVMTLEELWLQHVGVELETVIADNNMEELAKRKGYQTEGASWSQLFDQIFLNEVEPHFSKQPFFLIDFPARVSPLCRVKKDKPYLAERFEVFIAGVEIGNGNTENLDTELLRASFTQEKQTRLQSGVDIPPLDAEFMHAITQLKQTNKTFAGIGLGVDRLAMIMANVTDIKEVEPFALNVH